MYRPLSLFIGIRYTGAKRRNQFISFISLTSMIGMVLGVLSMIVVLSVMNGLQEEMRDRILGMLPQVVLSGSSPVADWSNWAERALENPQVASASPYTELHGMLARKGVVQAIVVNGILPEAPGQAAELTQTLQKGDLAALQPGTFGIILGVGIARRFGAQLGDKIVLIVPESVPGSSIIKPHLQSFTLLGVFKVGADLDNSLALIHIADAAAIKGWAPEQVQGIRLTVRDLCQAPEVAHKLAKVLGPQTSASDWTKTQGGLFQAMQMEKTMIALLLLLIIAVAAFNIIATLIMVVADKRTDIAILRTLGLSAKQVMAIFVVQGSVIGSVGVFLGAVLGVLLALHLTTVNGALEQFFGAHIFSSDLYYVSYLPSRLHLVDVLMVCTAGLLLSVTATIFPAWRASRILPAEAMRYE